MSHSMMDERSVSGVEGPTPKGSSAALRQEANAERDEQGQTVEHTMEPPQAPSKDGLEFALVGEELEEYKRQAAKLLPMHSPFAPPLSQGPPKLHSIISDATISSSSKPASSTAATSSSTPPNFSSFPTHSMQSVLQRLNEEAAARHALNNNDIDSLIERLGVRWRDEEHSSKDEGEDGPRAAKSCRRNGARKAKKGSNSSSYEANTTREVPRVTAGEILRVISSNSAASAPPRMPTAAAAITNRASNTSLHHHQNGSTNFSPSPLIPSPSSSTRTNTDATPAATSSTTTEQPQQEGQHIAPASPERPTEQMRTEGDGNNAAFDLGYGLRFMKPRSYRRGSTSSTSAVPPIASSSSSSAKKKKKKSSRTSAKKRGAPTSKSRSSDRSTTKRSHKKKRARLSS
ncbi:hypothetical protein QOT17_001203 [Balamuthia mandrillaris]